MNVFYYIQDLQVKLSWFYQSNSTILYFRFETDIKNPILTHSTFTKKYIRQNKTLLALINEQAPTLIASLRSNSSKSSKLSSLVIFSVILKVWFSILVQIGKQEAIELSIFCKLWKTNCYIIWEQKRLRLVSLKNVITCTTAIN